MANYTIPFKSLNGTDCVISISDGSGSTAIELSTENASAPGYPAAVPCEFMDDDTEDLLSVVRVKTGYINLVEKQYGGLSALYPQTDTQYSVTINYGSTTVFKGYMQAQAFENEWCAGPRELSFPIQSPLGLLNGKKFTYVHPPRMMTLGEIMKTVITDICQINIYQLFRIILPNDFDLLKCQINSLVISPYASGKYFPTVADVYDPITYLEFIEGFCNMYGLICYDTPSAVVFSRYERTSGYSSFYVGNLDSNPSGISVSGEALSLTLCDNHSIESLVRPLSRIEIDFDGEYKKKQGITFNEAVTNGSPVQGVDGSEALPMRTPNGAFTANQPFSSFSIGAEGKPTSTGVGLFVAGDDSKANEGILMYVDSNTSGKLFTVNLYSPPYNVYYLNVKAIWGNSIKGMGNTEDMEGLNGFALVIHLIDADGKYYNGSTWSTSVTPLTLNVNANGIGGLPFTNLREGPITVEVYASTSLEEADKVVMLTEFSIGVNMSVYADYIAGSDLSKKTIDLGNMSQEEGSISRLISFEATNSNHIYKPMTVGGSPTLPTYTYLGTSKKRLRVNGTGIIPLYPYLGSYTFGGVTGKIVACGMTPSEDMTTVVIQELNDNS